MLKCKHGYDQRNCFGCALETYASKGTSSKGTSSYVPGKHKGLNMVMTSNCNVCQAKLHYTFGSGFIAGCEHHPVGSQNHRQMAPEWYGMSYAEVEPPQSKKVTETPVEPSESCANCYFGRQVANPVAFDKRGTIRCKRTSPNGPIHSEREWCGYWSHIPPELGQEY